MEVEAGRVGRPHGLDGSFRVTRPEPSLLGLGTPVRVAGRDARIERRAGTDERPIVRVSGCDTREGAEALRGEPLLVAQSDLPELEPGEVWAHDLEGCAVTDGDRRVGVVRRLLGLPSVEVLEVDRGAGAEPLLVPLVHDAVRSLDLEGRRVDVDLAFLGEDPSEAAPGGGAAAADAAPPGHAGPAPPGAAEPTPPGAADAADPTPRGDPEA